MRGTNWGLLKSQMDRWQKPGDITDIPRASTLANADGSSNNGFASSRFLENGSFLRLRNVSLGYTLPKRLVAKAGIEKLRVYATVNNPFYIVKEDWMKHFDPEGQQRSVTIGVNVNF